VCDKDNIVKKKKKKRTRWIIKNWETVSGLDACQKGSLTRTTAARKRKKGKKRAPRSQTAESWMCSCSPLVRSPRTANDVYITGRSLPKSFAFQADAPRIFWLCSYLISSLSTILLARFTYSGQLRIFFLRYHSGFKAVQIEQSLLRLVQSVADDVYPA
jgi:hypothetical protein